jgi:asparagine synthase (glutamine-hydrolysing)
MLPKLDRAGMACGLEGRVPLLDDEFVEAMLAVPPGVHLAGGTSKAVLRRWAKELVPSVDVTRPKHGFDVPIGRWLQESLYADVRRLLLEPSAPGLLDRDAVRDVWSRAVAGVPGASHNVYALLVLAMWFQQDL